MRGLISMPRLAKQQLLSMAIGDVRKEHDVLVGCPGLSVNWELVDKQPETDTAPATLTFSVSYDDVWISCIKLTGTPGGFGYEEISP